MTMRRRFFQAKAAGKPLPTPQSLLSSLLNPGPVSAYVCKVNADCGMVSVTGNVRSLLGYAPGEFLADPVFWAVRIHPDDSARVFDEMPALFGGGPKTIEYRFRRADGRYIWLRDEMTLQFDPAGRPARIAGRWTDVTGLKLAAASAAQLMGAPGNETTETRGGDYAKQT